MSGFIEFCVELKSVSEAAAAAETDGEVSLPSGPGGSSKNGRGGRRGMLRRQISVVCSRVHSLNTISYVDNGELMMAEHSVGTMTGCINLTWSECSRHSSTFVFQEKKSDAWNRKEPHPSSPDRHRHPHTLLCKRPRIWSRVEFTDEPRPVRRKDQTWPRSTEWTR